MIHILPILRGLFLLVLANGAPVGAKLLLGDRLAAPLDFGIRLADGNPLFGTSKTMRGIVGAIMATALAGVILGLGWQTGALFGALAMAGDLLSSFTKRRLGRPSSSRATGIDQIPEALLPLFLCRAALGLSLADIAIGAAAFMLGEIYGSRILFRLHLRDRPY